MGQGWRWDANVQPVAQDPRIRTDAIHQTLRVIVGYHMSHSKVLGQEEILKPFWSDSHFMLFFPNLIERFLNNPPIFASGMLQRLTELKAFLKSIFTTNTTFRPWRLYTSARVIDWITSSIPSIVGSPADRQYCFIGRFSIIHIA